MLIFPTYFVVAHLSLPKYISSWASALIAERTINMYYPVYGCNSDSKTTSEMWFFRFPAGKLADQLCRRKAWIEFCKRKSFKPSSCTRICLLQFTEDVYEPGMSPAFLERLQCKETFRNQLKKDALPSLNKPTVDVNKISKKRSHSERRQRKKVILSQILSKLIRLTTFLQQDISSFFSVKTQTTANSSSTFFQVKPMTQSVQTQTSVCGAPTVVQNVPVESLCEAASTSKITPAKEIVDPEITG